MPGIAGFLGSGHAQESRSLLDRMIASLSHRNSHQFQTCQPELGAWIGGTSRKAVLHSGWNSSKDLAVLFYGEPQTHSQPASGSSLAQRFLEEYQRFGLGALEKLNGWFSGIILDLQKQETVLFNDRFGLGRIYFHHGSIGFFFSSEAKSILQVAPATKSLDEKSVGEWLSCGCALQDRTLFSNIFLLPPASAWTFSPNGKLVKARYFNPATWESQSKLSAEEFYTQLREVFPRALERCFGDDQEVGMSLTGGLDGRMIMSWMENPKRQLPCYTFNGPIRDCADVKIARQVARVCKQKHETIPLHSEFFDQFPSLAEQSVSITDGAMDVTGAAELYLNRKASVIAGVRLTGNYGSEILRSYVAFRPRQFSAHLLSNDGSKNVYAAAGTYAQEFSGNRLSFIAFKQVPWHHYSRFAVEQSQLTLRSPFLDNELVALAFRAPSDPAENLEATWRLIAEGNPELGRIANDRGVNYPSNRLSNRVRRPVQEFLAKAEYAYDYGMPDWLMRIDSRFAPLRLERLFLGRQKFCHFRTWYQRELAGYIKEILIDPRSRQRSYVNGAELEPMVKAHIQGKRNFTLEIHKLLSLELLHRTLLN